MPVANTSAANLPPSTDPTAPPYTPTPEIVRARSDIASGDERMRRRLTPDAYDQHMRTRALQASEAAERDAAARAAEEAARAER